MSGPCFIVGTFEHGGQNLLHLNVQDTFNLKEPIGLVWRLEAPAPLNLIAKEIKSAVSFFPMREFTLDFWRSIMTAHQKDFMVMQTASMYYIRRSFN